MPPLASACAVRELPARTEWLRVVGGLATRPGFWWLDSALEDARLGRFSFAGAEPWLILRTHGARATGEVRRARHPGDTLGRRAWLDDAFDALRLSLLPAPAPDEPALPVPFAGGLVVALAYELGAPKAHRALGLPDASALGVDRLYAVDHVERRVHALAVGVGAGRAGARRRAEAAADALARDLPDGDPPRAPPARGATLAWDGFFDAEGYAKAVEEIRVRIAAGDVYQACLTRRLEAPFPASAFALAGALRARNPAPFACLISLPDATLVGSSPERFLRVGPERWVESRPIKGTRPRAADPEQDRRERALLASSAKDRAENLMIVDLVRNDLGRVCEVGSVHVPELFAVESFATVHQLVSTVRGRLAHGRDALDAVRAAFPPGSMTGAPKLAAMALLARLEPAPRGLYSGAVGYLDLRGGCDLAVAIRSVVLSGGRALVHAGGGIVTDSDPTAEWRETEWKAQALLDAVAESQAEGTP